MERSSSYPIEFSYCVYVICCYIEVVILSTPLRKKKARAEFHAKQKQDKKYEKLLQSVKQAKREFKAYVQPKTYIRETAKIASFSTSNTISGIAPKKEANVYSGDYVVGIATMHKSNLVPVGRGTEPSIYATMRR